MVDTPGVRLKQAVFLGAVLWMAIGLAGRAGADSGRDPAAGKPGPVEVFLYFAAPDGMHLRAVPRQFPPGMDAHMLARELLSALMAGGNGTKPLFPENTRVNTLFITGSGDAYVDLGIEGPRYTDTITEYLGAYSLTNTLTVNIPKIHRVKILVNGAEGGGLGGHLSLEPFFKANMLIVK